MKLIKKLIAALVPKKLDAKAVVFPEKNFTYKRPENLTEEQCRDLPCFRCSTHTVSCWEFPFRDRLRFLFTGRLWLYLMMNGHPPVALMAESPFPKTKPETQAGDRRVFGQIVLGSLLGAFVVLLISWLRR